jgi:lysozyme family protein
MAWTYEATKAGYRALWDRATIRPEDHNETTAAANKIIANEARYREVQAATGVPWFWIGAIHMRESSNDFNGVLHNGERIIGSGRTTSLVPAGRGPFTSWSQAAIDALKLKNLDEVSEWTPEQMLFRAELFNGLGYVGKGVNSPYVWGGTSEQQAGKYVADHVWSSTAWDRQLGVAAVLKRLAEMRPDIAAVLSPQSEKPPVDTLPPDAWAQLERLLTNINTRLERLEKVASLPALPPPVIEQPKPPPPVTPKPAVGSDFIASLLALVGGIGLQGTGMVGLPVGEAGTTAGFLTTLLPIATGALSLFTGSGITGSLLGGLLNGIAKIAPANKK